MSTMRKITISAPEDLISFVDEQAMRNQTNRSRIISQILKTFREAELERVAAEGYRFYAEESVDFAEAAAATFSETLDDAIREDADDRETW